MTAHQYAALLLAGPDLPLFVGEYGSDDGQDYPVSRAVLSIDRLRVEYDEPELVIPEPHVYGLPGNEINDALMRQAEDLSGRIYRKLTDGTSFFNLPPLP